MEPSHDRPVYQVFITAPGQRDLKRLQKTLPKQQFEALDAAIRALGGDPRPQGCESLTNAPGVFRVRVGDYRILYGIDDQQQRVRIARVRHRRDVYRH